MNRYVGIDVAQEQCALCFVDDAGAMGGRDGNLKALYG